VMAAKVRRQAGLIHDYRWGLVWLRDLSC
jgi:hypothetical protein